MFPPSFPPSFPSSVPYLGLPFPPRGPVGTVPPLRRYYERLRLPGFHPASLRFPSLGGSQRRSVVRSRGGRARRPRAWASTGCPTVHRWRSQDLSGSWGSLCALAALSDPGPTSAPRAGGAPVLPACRPMTPAPTSHSISRLDHAARALPVYASQPGSPPDHATLGSRLVASLCRAGFVLPGSIRRFWSAT
jgi:hypothetical protein